MSNVVKAVTSTCGLLHLHQDEGPSLAGRVQFSMRLNPGVAIRRTHNLVRYILPVEERRNCNEECCEKR